MMLGGKIKGVEGVDFLGRDVALDHGTHVGF